MNFVVSFLIFILRLKKNVNICRFLYEFQYRNISLRIDNIINFIVLKIYILISKKNMIKLIITINKKLKNRIIIFI